MRLAWFSPLPPVPSGIAAYSAELLPHLSSRHAIDVFVASSEEISWATLHGVRACSAHAFVPRHHRAPYDLVVYQLGNSWCHDYMWAYAFQVPGLVVLHDAHLHHARAWSLLRRRRDEAYRAELAYDEPALDPDAAEIALSGFAGPIYYFWPLLRAVVAGARAVAAHSEGTVRDLADRFPDARAGRIAMGVADPLSPRAGSVDVDVRARHGIPRDALVFAAFGGVTPEKRIAQAIRAVAAARPYRRDLYLLLVGAEAALDVARAAAEACGIGDSTIVTGYVPDAELDAHLRAADAAFCLRWPTARETSASWLRAMAAGMPTIVTDLAHQTELPVLDPRTWQVAHGMPTLGTPEPIAIAIDILDEDHSLGLAVRRLVLDDRLRAGLGAAARAWWADRHTLAHMARDYDAALATAVAVPPPTAALPAHLRPDPFATARTLLAPFGLTPEALGLGERADLPAPLR